MAMVERYAFGDFVLERSQQRVLGRDGTEIALTPRLFHALLLFVESPGRLIEKDTLMRALWPGLVVEENNLSQVISALRRVLGDGPRDGTQGNRYIATVPRVGFRFVAQVRALTDEPPCDAGSPLASAAEAGTPLASPLSSSGPTAAAAAQAAAPTMVHPPDAAARRSRRWLLGGAVAGAAAGIGSALWWMQARPHRPTAMPLATVAVLPFKPLTADGRDELLEIGMADSLTSRLSALPGLVLRSTASVQRYAGAAQDPLRAARELDVDWVVDGTMQRRGDQLRATARLLHVADGTAAWSGSFDARLGGLFDVQDEIAARVQKALSPALTGSAPPGPAIAEPGGTRNPEAYQLYLAAVWRGQGGGSDSIQRATELLQQALAIDPGFAMAWTELAWLQRRRLWNADGVPADVFQQANAALARALALVPDLPHAHAGLGFTFNWFDFDWAAAEREYRSALSINPNVVAAHWGLTGLLLTQGRIDEGWGHLRRARELDPMSPLFNTMEAAYLADRGALDEAQRRLAIAFDLAPQLWLAHVAHGQLLIARGRHDDGIEALRRAVQFGHSTSRPRAVLGTNLAWLGQEVEARAILEQLRREAAARYVPPTSPAMVLAALGERPAALDALEQAWHRRDARLVFLKDDPSWRGLRDEPRYLALLKTLRLDGLPPGLTPV
jgi:DNA-binding winged helix-turn-helix (wHTH) protein/TolB-like protein/tetratricopeptide (TPR) repeat protein